jgi:hypothetical protein
MGNSFSSAETPQKEFQNFYEVIDFISTYYILTMDFKSLSKLSDKEYCNKIVLLSTDIIDKNFNEMEVTFLQKRVKDGLNVDDLKKEDLIFINKDKLEEDESSKKEKTRKCMGIAKFYVKIAHLFAAIVMTINPVYKYKDKETGKMVQTGLLEKDNIPKNTQRTLHKFNICDNRIRSLKRGKTYSKANDDTAVVFPKYCTLNYDKDGQLKDLEDEPGIKELLQLYLDDKYDYETGNFTGMSIETEKQFKKDLSKFYTAFTGKEDMPGEYNKFSDIKLHDYKKTKEGCQGKTPKYKKIDILKKDDLFVAYALNIKEMIQRAVDTQQVLLQVIDKLFKISDGKIRIHPDLTDDVLQKAVENARKIIIDLYVQCEEDYVKGLKIYESIVETKILDTTPNQIKTFENMSNQILKETNQAAIPKEEPLVKMKPLLKSEDVELLNVN